MYIHILPKKILVYKVQDNVSTSLFYLYFYLFYHTYLYGLFFDSVTLKLY